MTLTRLRSIPIAAGLLLGSLSALADMPSVKSVDAPPVASSPRLMRTAVLTDVRTALARGDSIGKLYSGAACETTADREWSDLTLRRVQTDLSVAFRDEIARTRGPLLAADHGATPLRVQAVLDNIDVQVCQAAAGAWRGGFYVQVDWQIVSPDSGKVVYQTSTEGSFMLNEPQRTPTAEGLREAFGVAVRNLIADRGFAAMLEPAERHRVAQLAY